MRLLLIALTILIAEVLTSGARAQDRIALVIGNDRYGSLPADRQLTKAINDARAVGGALEKLGFKVIRGENLNRAQMVDHVFNFTQAIKPGDTALVFFAGHGVSFSGGNYLLPTDIPLPKQGEEPRARNLSLGEADIIADIQERKPRILVMMLDACRDNPFKQPGLTRSIGNEAGLARAREAEGVFSIYSAGFGQTALDSLGSGDKSPNSVFTRALVPALARTDVHLADLVIDMREEVSRLAATVGHQQYPAYYDQTRGGRVYLAGRPAPATPAPHPAPPPVAARPSPAVAALPPASELLGRVWEEEELDGWRGIWTRRGDSNAFDGVFTHRSGGRETATLEIGISNGRVNIERTQSNGKCRYEGRLAGRNVQGTYGCDWAKGPFQWKAEIKLAATDALPPQAASAAPPAPQKPQAVAAVQPAAPVSGSPLRESWQQKFDFAIFSAAISRDGRFLALGGLDIHIVNADTGQKLRSLGTTEGMNALSFSPDGKLLASVDDKPGVRLWAPATGKLIRKLESKASSYQTVAFSPEGNEIAAGGGDKTVDIWDTSGRLLRSFKTDSITVRSLAFSPDGRWIATAGGYLNIWDRNSGALVKNIAGHSGVNFSVAFSPDSKRLVTGGTDKDSTTVKIWDTRSGELLRTLTGHTERAETVAISPDGRTVVSGGLDNNVRIWNAETGLLLQTIGGHAENIRSIGYSADGGRVAWGAANGLVRVFAPQ